MFIKCEILGDCSLIRLNGYHAILMWYVCICESVVAVEMLCNTLASEIPEKDLVCFKFKHHD